MNNKGVCYNNVVWLIGYVQSLQTMLASLKVYMHSRFAKTQEQHIVSQFLLDCILKSLADVNFPT